MTIVWCIISWILGAVTGILLMALAIAGKRND